MNLIKDRVANLMRLAIRLRDHHDEQARWATTLVDPTLYLNDRLFALNQLLIEARAFSFEQ